MRYLLTLFIVFVFCVSSNAADLDMNVDIALSGVPVNIYPLTDDTDFKSREVAIAFDQAGMDLVWNFVTTAGAFTQTVVTPTTGGDYDWVNQGDGMYTIEIPASGGASINNDTEGFGWFTGYATGILPWRGPVIRFRAEGLNNLLIDSPYSSTRGLAGTALPNAAADAPGGLPISDDGGLDLDTQISTKIDSISDQIDLVYDSELIGSAIPSLADSVTITSGIEAGSYTDTYYLDLTYHQMTQDTNTIYFSYDFDIGEEGLPIKATAKYRLDEGVAPSGGDSMTWYVYDWVALSWDTLGSVSGIFGSTSADDVIQSYYLFPEHVGTGANDGIVRFRFWGGMMEAGTTSYVDYLHLDYAVVLSYSGIQAEMEENGASILDTVSVKLPTNYIMGSSVQTDKDDEIDNILTDTNELQTDWTNGGRLDLIVDAILEDTGVTLDDLVDDLETRLTAARAGYLDELGAANIPADIDTLLSRVIGTLAAGTHNAQSGDSYDIVNDGTYGNSSLQVLISALNDLSAADVNAQVLDVLNTDTFSEPGQGAPPASPTIQQMVHFLYKAWRNKTETTADNISLYDDAGTTVDHKNAISDDGTTFTKGEYGTGP